MRNSKVRATVTAYNRDSYPELQMYYVQKNYNNGSMRAPLIPLQSNKVHNSCHLMIIIQTLDTFVGKEKPF